jgi:hypothetical protein
MDSFKQIYEQFRVQGKELVEKIEELIHEGNVRRVIIKNEHGHTFMEIPVTVAAIGVILAPVLAAVGAIATLAAHFDVVVERAASDPAKPAAPASPAPDAAGKPASQGD